MPKECQAEDGVAAHQHRSRPVLPSAALLVAAMSVAAVSPIGTATDSSLLHDTVATAATSATAGSTLEGELLLLELSLRTSHRRCYDRHHYRDEHDCRRKYCCCREHRCCVDTSQRAVAANSTVAAKSIATPSVLHEALLARVAGLERVLLLRGAPLLD